MHRLQYQEFENGSCSFNLFGNIEVALNPISIQLWEQLNAIPKLPNGLEDNIEFIIQAVLGLCCQWGANNSISESNLIEFLEQDARNLEVFNAVLMRHFPKALDTDVVASRVAVTPDGILTIRFFNEGISQFRKLTLSDFRVISRLPLKNGDLNRFEQLFYTGALTTVKWFGSTDPITPDTIKSKFNERIPDVLLLEAALSDFNKSEFEF